MQEHNLFSSINLSQIISKCSLSNILIIAEFIDPKTIQLVLSGFPHIVAGPNLRKFLEIIFVKKFIAQFLHQVDRSNYMTIYEEKKFMEIENNRIKNLWLNSYPKFNEIKRTITNIKKGLCKELSSFFDVQQALDNMFLSLNDPMPPELSLRKSDIGAYCNSSFQFYLIGKRFPSKEKFVEEPFSELRLGLEELRDDYFLRQKWIEKMDEEVKQKIGYFSQFWYKINSENYRSYLISSESNYVSKIHNSMVNLVTLFDGMVEIVDEYLETFSEDFLHEFIQFSVRFAMLRNSLLELEKKLDFLFQMYNQIVRHIDVTKTSQSDPKTSGNLSVWRCLLSKWYLYMKKRHESLNVIYCYLFKKMNYSQFCSNLKSKQINLSQYIMSLQNSLESIQEEINGSMMFSLQSPLMDFTQDNQFVHQLLKQYVEYMVDISVNEDSVHWCGHSDHQMHLPFQDYSQVVVQSLNHYLQKIYHICHQIDSSDAISTEIIQKILQEMDKDYLKPFTLKKLTNQINQTWGQLFVSKYKYQKNQVPQFQKDQTSQQVSFQLIKTINFAERDKRVESFNISSKIPSKFDYSCNIVIESQDFNSSLKRSANTNCTQSGDHSYFDRLQVFEGMSKSISIDCDF